jgi:hypothetical protein
LDPEFVIRNSDKYIGDGPLRALKEIMKTLEKIAFAVILCSSATLGTTPLWAQTAAAPAAPSKNWTPPTYKIYAQILADEIKAKHPELISITFHGVPPGAAPKTYTMYAGSYPDRIGNPDDPDDVMIIETGITILDPRWHRTKDPIKKYVPMLPLRDAAGENIGLLVLAYKNPADDHKTDLDFLKAATDLRDTLQTKIPSHKALFDPAK